MFCSPPGSSVLGISQGRTMEWVAISFSRGSSWLRDGTCISNSASGFFTTSHLGSPFVTLYRGGNWHFGNRGLRGSTPNKKRKLKFKPRSHMDWMFVAPQIHGLKPYSPATCWFLRWGCKEVIRIQNIQKWSPPDEMSTFISRGREGETFLALCIREEELGEDTVSRQPQTGQEGGSADPAPAGSLTSHSSLQNLRKHIPAIQAPQSLLLEQWALIHV